MIKLTIVPKRPGPTAIDREAGLVRSEIGDTLIEVLMALVIISLAVSGLMGALITSIAASGEQRSLSVEDTLLRSYAERAEYQIQYQSSPTPPLFKECATPSDYPISLPTPSGFTVAIGTIQYWNGSTFDSSCASNDQTGVQLVTLNSKGPGAIQTLSFVVRNPNYVPTE